MEGTTIGDWAVLSFIVIPLFLVAALAAADAVASRRIGEAHAATRRGYFSKATFSGKRSSKALQRLSR